MIGNEQKTPFAKSITDFTQNKIDDTLNNMGRIWPCSVTAVTGAIVTVNFEVNAPSGVTLPPVTCPIAESTYVRLPVQVGDLGIVVAADTRLGGITGLGTGLADLVSPTNLGSLVFVPIGNSNWSSVNANAVNVNGPDGVILRDTGNNCTLTLTPTGITGHISNTTFTINASGITLNYNSNSELVVSSSGISGTVGSSSINISGTEIDLTAASIVLNGSVTVNGTVTGTMSVGSITASGDVTASGVSLVSHLHSGVMTGGSNTGPPV